MPGMPYKIKSIVTRKLEGVNHFHYYLCRQLKGGGMEIFMSNKKVIYNYNIEQSNQLIKKGMFPIGCGINPKTGGFFLVFYGTKGYYNTLDLIALENEQKEHIKG